MLRFFRRKLDLFTVLSMVSGILILVPLTHILFGLFQPVSSEWMHIRRYLLLDYVSNSMVLVILVALMAILIGASAAYVVARYDFKGRKLFGWMMVLPLGVPSYIAGYVYADMTSFTGTISRFLRLIGIHQSLDIMHLFGASVIFAFTLYPYVYLLALASLSKQSATYLDSARLLGAGKVRRFMTVTLPLMRPALVAGSLLVILETLNDYGLVAYFNVRVFSFAIFNAWFTLGDVTSAIRLSAYLMILVFSIVLIERALRGKRRYHMPAKSKVMMRKKPTKTMALGIYVLLSFVLAIGFFIPVFQMLWHAGLTLGEQMNISLLQTAIQTIVNGGIATLIIVIIALIMTNFNRMHTKKTWRRYWVKLSNLGYAIPGAVIAVAVHLFFVDMDRALSPIYRIFDPDSPTLLLTMSLFTLIFAYVLRFLSIGFNSVESQYDKIGDHYTESAYLLGSSKMDALIRVDMPLIYPGLITAFILVFVDVIKELPLTLILRPTNYDTLSTAVYVYARNEMIQEASIPSLILIMLSTVLIYIVTHYKKGVFSHVY